MTSTPDDPIRRNRPPVASFVCSFFAVPDSSAPSDVIVLVTMAPAPLRVWIVSVLAAPLPEISSSHGRSPRTLSRRRGEHRVNRIEVVFLTQPLSERPVNITQRGGRHPFAVGASVEGDAAGESRDNLTREGTL